MTDQKDEDKDTAGNKDVTVRFRATAKEKAAILVKADKAGLKPSEYMRDACLGKEIKERMPLEVRRYIIGIGTNLNQLTRLANAGKLSLESQGKLGKLVDALSDLLLAE